MPKDYADSGLDLQYAFMAATKEGQKVKKVPPTILWGGKFVQNSDHIDVPCKGRVTLRFSEDRVGNARQGADIEIVDGHVVLADGSTVNVLRTWSDDRYEDTVEYSYHSPAGKIIVWNVYKMIYGGGQVVEERWTGNAGMVVEKLTALHRRYRASPGFASPPDFDAFQFEVEITAP